MFVRNFGRIIALTCLLMVAMVGFACNGTSTNTNTSTPRSTPTSAATPTAQSTTTTTARPTAVDGKATN